MIKKKTLSEISLYTGTVKMPEGFAIEKDRLVKDILMYQFYDNVDYPFSRTYDRLQTYFREFMQVEQNITLIEKSGYGNFYERNETSKPQCKVDPVDLRESPDFVLLYGVEIDSDSCKIHINYDDNRRKNRTWSVPLKTDDFIMFPADKRYYVENRKNTHLNFIQTITFTYV
jgi:hypothetical protein|tara:strand:- start:2232 stop:2747 length:516 start_codon:yes stop_codon:yes gene_type:complete